MSYLELELPAITITTEDARHLSLLASSDTRPANSLAREISRANIIPGYQALGGLVRMGSLVTYRDDMTCQLREVTLVYPHETDGDPSRVSVLTPGWHRIDRVIDRSNYKIRNSPRPVVLAPAGTRPILNERVLFSWDAPRSAVRALHDVLPLMSGSREVIVVSVLDDKALFDLQSGEQICSYLARWGIGARFRPIRRGSEKVGLLLLDFAKRLGASAIVMGGFGHPREREFIFGSATRDVFQSRLEIPVFLSH